MRAVESGRIRAIVCDSGKLSQVAIIQELGRLGIPVVALADSPRAIGFGSRYASQRIICPYPSYDPRYIGFLLSDVPRGVIFYSNDANTENIARHQRELREHGFSLFVADPGTLERVISKDRLYRTALECGVSVPRCDVVSSAEELEERLGEYVPPVILKSTNLAGGVYRFIPDRAAAHAVFRQMTEVISDDALRHRGARLMVQQWVPQEHAALWNFNACVKSGEIVSFCMGRRIRTDRRADGTLGSILLFGVTAFHERIFEENRRLLSHLKFDGLVETEWSECTDDGGRLYLYDFNPRPSGNIRWCFRSGVSLAQDYYRLALGQRPEPGTMKAGTRYVKLFYRNNDPLEAMGNPRLSRAEKLGVLAEDVKVLARCRRHAVDVLDAGDPGPTWRAAVELAPVLGSSLRRLIRRVGSFFSINHHQAGYVSR